MIGRPSTALNDSRVPVWTNLPRVPSLSLLLSPPLRADYSEAKVILLDEPLAAMGAKESAIIIDLILELKQRGDVSMILIAHTSPRSSRSATGSTSYNTGGSPTRNRSVRRRSRS
ncbi:MAG: hypothetical protein ACRDX9_15305 [Acidimicrobiia bacterium]